MTLNINDWVAVNKQTGEEIGINLLATRDGGDFNKVFCKEFAAMIRCTGSGAETVLAWIIESKNNKNEVYGTQRVIAKNLNVSPTTVSKVFKALMSQDFLRLRHSGCYILSMDAIHYGNMGNKMAILKVWNDLK